MNFTTETQSAQSDAENFLLFQKYEFVFLCGSLRPLRLCGEL